MKIDGLAMQPFSTTLMGVLKGVLDCFDVDLSAATVFGASGHAFLINIHKQLCPSGPYCWKYDGFNRLIGNLGVRMTDLGFYSPSNSADDRAAVEQKLRDALDAGRPCSLCNLENQTITGYDDEGLDTTQPWAPKMDFPPARLSFGNWQEFGDEFHVKFFTFEKTERTDERTTILDSLAYAVDLHRNPSTYNLDAYGIGPDAYANWKAAVAEYGSSHGNWWNATVWSECRAMASEYFTEIARTCADVSTPATDLAAAYAEIAATLGKLADKEMPPGEKTDLLDQVESKEAEAIDAVESLAASLKSRA